MSGNPAHSVDILLRSSGKGQFHKRLHLKACKLALQLRSILFVYVGAGFPVEGKNNGIKDGGLACPRIPCDQEKVLGRFPKINGRNLLSVGSECLHGQFQRFHLISPPGLYESRLLISLSRLPSAWAETCSTDQTDPGGPVPRKSGRNRSVSGPPA